MFEVPGSCGHSKTCTLGIGQGFFPGSGIHGIRGPSLMSELELVSLCAVAIYIGISNRTQEQDGTANQPGLTERDMR